MDEYAKEVLGSLITAAREHSNGQDCNLDLFNARARYVLRYTIALHRFGSHKDAHQILTRIQVALEDLSTRNCHVKDIMPLIRYWKGRFSIQLHWFDDARTNFDEAMKLICSNLDEHFIEHQRDGSSPQLSLGTCCYEAVKSAQYRMGSVLAFGLAQVFESERDLSQAMQSLLPALTLLRFAGDTYRLGVGRLQLGSLQRMQGETDLKRLADAGKTLDEARQLFLANHPIHEHKLYVGYTHHECAELYLAMYDAYPKPEYLEIAKSENASAKEKATDTFSIGYKDIPLSYAVKLIDARIALFKRQYGVAISTTTEVVEQAHGKQEKSSHAEALIIRGQAYRARFRDKMTTSEAADLRSAEDDFTKAREQGSGHKLIAAKANLHLVDILYWAIDIFRRNVVCGITSALVLPYKVQL